MIDFIIYKTLQYINKAVRKPQFVNIMHQDHS